MLKLLNPVAGLASDLIGVAGSALGSGFIAEFVRSESGEVSPKQGFSVAWTGGLLIAAMVVLGSPPPAVAHCGGLESSSSCNSNTDCGHHCSGHGGNDCGGSCHQGYCACYPT